MKKEKGKRRPNDGDNVNTEITTTNKQVCLGLVFTDGAELTLDTNLWQTVHHDDWNMDESSVIDDHFLTVYLCAKLKHANLLC